MEAPVTASQGAMRSLPMKLESLLSGPEKGLRAEEKKKLRILQSDLQGLVEKYLLEPSEVESPASTASSWMEGVRDLSYDIDDFIYELTHVAAGGPRINVIHKPPRFKISRFPEKLRRRQWIVDDISLFRTRVKETIRRYRDYLGSNCKWRPSSGGQPPPASPSGDTAIHLVGVDTYIKQLCSWLTNDGQPEHKVASIVGAGGVGKTTLAKQVYRMLGGQFECLAFVRTSTKADMKGLLTSILSQVRRQKLPSDGTCDVHSLVLNIKKHLQYKTYLIVIEDLWALSTWDLVDRSLPKGNCCSRILTTTEVEVIALACCADNSKCIPAKKVANSRYIIKKEPLSEDESRELFLGTAFGKQAECPQHLKEVSDEIIKIIGGLPLAINILANLLARQPASSIEQWNYIKNSLSSALTTNASLERINQVLNLGYDNLPHYLKACMLYLCLYEEGCIIWKDDLVKQWIAEDFIGTLQGDDGEEVARSYFGELVNRGMIQPVDIDCNDEILSCTVHHLVLHFIRDKSMEENFCIALDHSQTTIRLADKIRRLALHFGNVEDAMPPGPESMRLSKVRSVAFSGFLKCMPSIVEFQFLQVLILKLLVNPDKMGGSLTASDDLSGNITEPGDLSDNLSEPDDLGYNLTGISELFRLRYFHLDACHMSVALPTKMQQLKDLVAWEIDAEVTAVSSDIVDLPGLLYLSIPSEAHLPTGIGRMTSLRTLGVFDLSNKSTEHVMSLGELTNLQELRLTCSTLQPANLECLGLIVWKLRNLKHVTLVPAVSTVLNTENDADSSSMSVSWLHISTQPLPPALLQTLELSRRCCIFSTLPKWTKELTNLCILKIAVRKLSKEDVAILKGLPSLATLSVFILTAPASRIMFDYEGFSVLKYFKFVCAAPCLAFLIGAMPKVRKVKLGFNANRMKGYSLDAAGFRHLTGLNEISIKIGGTGVSEHNRRSTQSVLTTTIGNHPSTPIINVQWVDWNFSGDDEKYIDEHRFQEKNFEEDAKKQADIRTYMPLESTLHPQTTDGIAEKHEDASGGHGEIYKPHHHPEREKQHMMQYSLEKMSSSEKDAMPIQLHLLKTITEDFSEKFKVGSGSYGEVYKGVLNGDEIAVKKLFPVHGLDDVAFENEFLDLKKVRHKNVIQMVGYCYEIAHRCIEYNGQLVFARVMDRALCSEYMKGGSLAKHISAESCIHDWPTTYNIIKGTCEGLHHLHIGGEKKIFHLDLKPDNVLLDEKLVPKIGDFGLSELFGSSYIHQLSSTKATIGFMPQEYIRNRKVSPKNDVFSLGVIIFHMMAGKRGYEDYRAARQRPNFSAKNQQEFVENVQEYWKTKMQATGGYRWDETDHLGVTKCIDMSIRCVEDDQDNRPYIMEIINELKELDSKVEEMLKTDRKPPIAQLPHHHPEREKRHIMQYSLEKMSSSEKDAMPIQLHLLKTITEDFSEKFKVGSGSYGEVYKGVLNGDEIAIKKLFPVYGLDNEAFDNEFRNLKKVQHKNVIRMIGYFYEISHKDVEYKGQFVWTKVIDRALCFEYMKGGSLAKHISAKSCIHDWPTTYKIIKGTCEGLHHLHIGGEKKIFHLDLKPDNVLLDEKLVPKIGDFGLSKLFGSSYTHQLSSTKGTIEFMPQEYIHRYQVSSKNDVFSLGVIIFHIMAGEKGYGDYLDARRRPNFSPKIQQEFTESVQGYWNKKMQATEGYRWDQTDLLGVTRCIEMAMRCVEDDRDKRPYIWDIIGALNKLDSEVAEMLKKHPKPPIGQLKSKNHVNDLEAVKQNKSLNDLGKDIVVDPLKLCFPFESNKDIRCCLQLINKGESSHIAFNINTDLQKYHAQPNKGIIAPYSHSYITLTLRAQELAPPNMECVDELVVQAIRVPEHFTSDEITQDFLANASAVHEVTLPIVYVALDQ